jgi:hypothetical protein
MLEREDALLSAVVVVTLNILPHRDAHLAWPYPAVCQLMVLVLCDTFGTCRLDASLLREASKVGRHVACV